MQDVQRMQEAQQPAQQGQKVCSAGATRRTLLVLYLCTGVAGLALFDESRRQQANARLARDPMAGYYSAQMPRYPGVREVPASRELRVAGNQARMSYFRTSDDVAKVADYYTQFWRGRGLWVTTKVNHRGGVVSAVDGSQQQVLQVLLFARHRSTLVLPTVTHAPLRALGRHEQSELTPLLFAGSRVLMHSTTEVQGVWARTLLSLNQGSLDENLAHYRTVLQQAGYREDPSSERVSKQRATGPHAPLQGTQILVFQQADGAEVTLSLQWRGPRETRVQLVQVGP